MTIVLCKNPTWQPNIGARDDLWYSLVPLIKLQSDQMALPKSSPEAVWIPPICTTTMPHRHGVTWHRSLWSWWLYWSGSMSCLADCHVGSGTTQQSIYDVYRDTRRRFIIYPRFMKSTCFSPSMPLIHEIVSIVVFVFLNFQCRHLYITYQFILMSRCG